MNTNNLKPYDVFQLPLEQGRYDGISETASLVYEGSIPHYQVVFRLAVDGRAISAKYPLTYLGSQRTRTELNKLGFTSLGELDQPIRKMKVRILVVKRTENGIEVI